MTTEDPGPLANAVRQRRLELGLAQGDLAARGGPAIATVGLIESGKMRTPRPLTLAGLERALGWTRGSAARAMLGQAPRVGDSEEHVEPTLSVVRGILAESQPPADIEENEVLAAVLRDPYLDEDARKHYLAQYELLVEVSARRRAAAEAGAAERLSYVAHGKRTTPVDDAEEKALEDRARAAARRSEKPQIEATSSKKPRKVPPK